MRKSKMVIIGMFLVGIIGISIYFSLFYVNLKQYNFYKTLQDEVSPDGQYKVDLILLGEKVVNYIGYNLQIIMINVY